MNIEIKKTKSEDYALLIDGIIDNQTIITTDVGTFQISTSNTFLMIELKTWAISKFKDYKISWLSFELNGDTYFEKDFFLMINNNEKPIFAIDWRPKSENWNKVYSILDFVNEIKSICNKEIEFHESYYLDGSFGIRNKVDNEFIPIKQYFDEIVYYSIEIEGEVEKNMLDRLNTSSIIEYFNFPQEYETACRQYLSYFVDFLRDLGINATSNILSEEKKTIFIVKPDDKRQALELIKETLSIYLNLPTVPELKTLIFFNQDIAVQQLVSNIQFLQSQVLLGNAILQSKDATIKSLELTNYQLTEIIESKSKDINAQKQGEDIINGILSVDKLEKNGITIDLAELLRRLKRKLK